MAIGSIIETGVDKLVELVKERQKISMQDAAKELGVSLTVIEEWSDFLEEEGIISIEYKFTKPFLVGRKLTKTEVTKKAKEFTDKKEVFVRKAEGTLRFLEREASKLKGVKEEVDKLKKEFGLEIGTVKSDIAELEKYHQLKTTIDEQINQQKIEMQQRISDMTGKILREQKKYYELLTEVKKEEEELKKEKAITLTIEESEKLLKERLFGLKATISKIENKIANEDLSIKNSGAHIKKLKNLTNLIKQNLKKEKVSLKPLLKKSQEQQQKIQQVQNEILKKISKKEDRMKITKKASEKFKSFFNKKMQVLDFIDTINKDRNSLEKELIELIKKAKSFNLASKSDIGKQMLDLEQKFEEVDKKKKVFEQEFKKLNILFKK